MSYELEWQGHEENAYMLELCDFEAETVSVRAGGVRE